MKYNKPVVVLLGSANQAVQGTSKNHSTTVESGSVYTSSMTAYEADE